MMLMYVVEDRAIHYFNIKNNKNNLENEISFLAYLLSNKEIRNIQRQTEQLCPTNLIACWPSPFFLGNLCGDSLQHPYIVFISITWQLPWVHL